MLFSGDRPLSRDGIKFQTLRLAGRYEGTGVSLIVFVLGCKGHWLRAQIAVVALKWLRGGRGSNADGGSLNFSAPLNFQLSNTIFSYEQLLPLQRISFDSDLSRESRLALSPKKVNNATHTAAR